MAAASPTAIRRTTTRKNPMAKKPTNTEQRFASNVQAATDKLKQAITLHQGHVDGSVETSEESQQEMMDQMTAAMAALDDEGMDDMEGMKALRVQINHAFRCLTPEQ